MLHTPIWKQRVYYIHGSALRDSDLERAKYERFILWLSYKIHWIKNKHD